MTDAEIKTMIDESIKKAFEVKPAEPTPETPQAEPVTAEVIQKMIADAVKKADEPGDEPLTLESVRQMITEAIEPVLKARGLASNLNGDGDPNPNVKKGEEPHYLTGII